MDMEIGHWLLIELKNINNSSDLLVPPCVLNQTDSLTPYSYNNIDQLICGREPDIRGLTWRAVARPKPEAQAEFIYGGPHALFSHLRRSKSPGGTAAAQDRK